MIFNMTNSQNIIIRMLYLFSQLSTFNVWIHDDIITALHKPDSPHYWTVVCVYRGRRTLNDVMMLNNQDQDGTRNMTLIS